MINYYYYYYCEQTEVCSLKRLNNFKTLNACNVLMVLLYFNCISVNFVENLLHRILLHHSWLKYEFRNVSCGKRCVQNVFNLKSFIFDRTNKIWLQQTDKTFSPRQHPPTRCWAVVTLASYLPGPTSHVKSVDEHVVYIYM